MVTERQYNIRLIAIIITVVISLFSVECRAQTFSNLYYDNRPAMLFSSIEATDSSYYVTGVSNQKTAPFYRRAVIGSITHDGITDSLCYLFDLLPESYEIFGNSLKKAGNHYIAVGSVVDSVSRAFIVRFDSAFNILFYHTYSDTISEIFQGFDVEEVKEGGYLLAINRSLNTNNDVMVIRTDSLGEVINKRIYQAGSIEYPWVIRPMLNGHYMVGAFTRKGTTNTPFWCKTWLIELDSMGDMVRQWLDSNPENRLPKSMQQTADSGWIIVRQHLAYDVGGFQVYNAGIVKYDKNFTKEWEHYYGDSSDVTGFYDVEILPDGKYIVCGTTPIWGSDSAHRFGWVIKFDTDGTMLWERKYVALERNGTHSYLYDIDMLPNGDLIACGELLLTMSIGISPIQQGWILRTDSNGCEVENCLIGVSDDFGPVDHKSIQIWPNPTNKMVSIEILPEMIGGDIRVIDIAGRIVIQQNTTKAITELDVKSLDKGLYIVVVEKHGKTSTGKLIIDD